MNLDARALRCNACCSRRSICRRITFTGSMPTHRIPDAVCARYDAAIGDGFDLVILGIGTNGHLGMNEPGSPADSPTRRVDLEESTVQASARYFPSIDREQVTAMGAHCWSRPDPRVARSLGARDRRRQGRHRAARRDRRLSRLTFRRRCCRGTRTVRGLVMHLHVAIGEPVESRGARITFCSFRCLVRPCRT